MMDVRYDVIIIGGGAAGLMCAAQAGKRGRDVLVINHDKKIGEKIRISGGGRCNFTNVNANQESFLSQNGHFCKSALKQYSARDFIELVERHGILYHEKKIGQLFCNDSAQAIIDMLLEECQKANVVICQGTSVDHIESAKTGGYIITTNQGIHHSCQSLVIATGGLSVPKTGATKFGYDVARKFGLNVVNTYPALVPFTFQSHILERCKLLSGLSLEATVSCAKISFSDGLLFTHRGLSGPVILQISSYWNEGDEIVVNLAPDIDMFAFIKERKQTQPKQDIQTILSHILANRLAESICVFNNISGRIADLPDKQLKILSQAVNGWRIKPAGTEGYRSAEVTLGGVDTNELSSKTMEVKKQPGLYFIGEVVDVTGHLGGFNFQWAWSSGYVAGHHA